MWPCQHLDENVVSPMLNDAEEVANMSSYSSSPPMSPLLGFAEEDRQMSTSPGTTWRTQRSSVDGVEPNTVAESGTFYQECPSSANVFPPPSGRSRSPLRLRPAAWRRGIHLPPLRGARSSSRNTRETRMGHSLSPVDEEIGSEEEGSPDTLTSSTPNCTSVTSSVDLLLLKTLESYVLSVGASEEPHRVEIQMNEVFWPNRHSRLVRLTDGNSSSAGGTGDNIQTQSEDESLSEDTDIFRTRRTTNSSIFSSDITFNIFQTKRSPPPEPSPHRRQFRSIQSMPQPSLLAKQVANRVIKYARCARNIHEEEMCCLNCGLFPIYPVTGKCGHTRCTKCVEVMGTCPCGEESPESLYVNILIRDLLEKTAECRNTRPKKGASSANSKKAVPANKLLIGVRGSSAGPIRAKRGKRPYVSAPIGPYEQHVPMSARARFAYALELLQSGKHEDAAPHLALAAASCHSDMRVARSILAQVVMVLSNKRDPRSLTRELNHFVRQLTSISWIKTTDMECVLCSDIFTKPVTTPCGHMFCRTCLEKTLDYRKRCPLCLRGMGDFKLNETNDTVFVKRALATVNALSVPKPMEEEDIVPIFVCTVAYPSVPCPLFIFDPRYWLMIRRVLESESRRFGMVAMDRDKKYADYGTILEVRDCVHLEDGRSILSTMGVSRFKVIERSVRDGCEVARIQPILDIPPDDGMSTHDLKMYGSQILLKALLWLSQLGTEVLTDIENAFGTLPTSRELENEVEWWETNDGPSWLWWLVAVLPLRTEIKILILSTDCLVKRMMAVARTLEAVARITLTTLTPEQCEVPETTPSNDTLIN